MGSAAAHEVDGSDEANGPEDAGEPDEADEADEDDSDEDDADGADDWSAVAGSGADMQTSRSTGSAHVERLRGVSN